MRSTYVTAIVIAMLIGVWLLSGQLGVEESPPPLTLSEQANLRGAQQADAIPSRVRARVTYASPQVQHLRIRGKTENKRTVAVRAQITGTVTARPVERGSRVAAGEALCRVSVDDRRAGLRESEAELKRAQIEYQGRLKLRADGLQSDTLVAQAQAKLAEAQAEFKRSQLSLARTVVKAPFAGIVEDVHLEVGDYVTPGAQCATLVDLDPMLLVGRVSERDVLRVLPGQTAAGLLSDGTRVSGQIQFVGQQSDPETRSYALEVRIPNPSYRLRSGVTTDILIPVAEVMAQRVSPALFALNDEGVIGVRTVDADGRVAFNPIEIVRDEADGVWVTGLPEVATVITVGQELVVPGQSVEVDFEPVEEMPASAPPQTAAPAEAVKQA
ncbi:MAG: efflux RND transporter periplasmic adaptor subunit [Gammaproteobacteria bacterium]|nr:efflux RND transporter periplasmic adaptor subunit [Gammaproteobacteria bacterium]